MNFMKPGVFYLQKMRNFMKPGVFYLQKLMNFMKMTTSYKKLPLFIKNSILHTYKKTQTSNWAFIKKTPFLEILETPEGDLLWLHHDDHLQRRLQQSFKTCTKLPSKKIKVQRSLARIWHTESPVLCDRDVQEHWQKANNDQPSHHHQNLVLVSMGGLVRVQPLLIMCNAI